MNPLRHELADERAFLVGALERLHVGADVEDLVQEVLCAALEAWTMRPDELDELRPWLYGIARHKAHDHRRVLERQQEYLLRDDPDFADEVPAPGSTPEEMCVRGEGRSLLGSLLGRLDPDERDLLIAIELGETGLAELAAQLGVRINTLKTRLRRARASLRALARRHAQEAEWRCAAARLP